MKMTLDLESQLPTILIIDDAPANLAVIVDYLETQGFQVVVARDGLSGLQRASYVHPDLILLDVMMPQMDGFETCRHLKAAEETKDIPVIFMTALANTQSRLTGFEVGGVDYITKPFQIKEVLARIRTHLELRSLHKQLEAKNARLQQEISEHQRTEQILKEREALLETLIDNLPIEFWVLDTELRYMILNAASRHMIGDVLGKRFDELDVSPALVAKWAEQNQQVLTGASIREEYMQVFDDLERVFESILAPVIVDGTVVGIVGTGLDITARKQAEKILRDSHAELERRVAERTAELAAANTSLRAENTERRRVEKQIQRRNRELALLNRIIAASVTQTQAEAILEIACRELAQAFGLPRATATLLNREQTEARVAAEYVADGQPQAILGQTFSLENEPLAQYFLRQPKPIVSSHAQHDPQLSAVRDLLKQGETVSLLAVPLLIEDQVIGSLSINAPEIHVFSAEDISLAASVANQVASALAHIRLDEAHTQLEAQYHQAQKMEAIGRLTGGVAHDFNNILTVIVGHCDLLLEELGPDHPSRPSVNQVLKAATMAASLTRQLLAFSRQQVLQPQVLELNQIVTQIEKMLRRLIGENIALETRLDPDLGQIKADPGQLEQVIMNLAVNARDAMPEGGSLTIETANVFLDEAYCRQHPGLKSGPHIMLAVVDTGLGMDAETQARIFEPFFTTKEQGKGTGLGLATVHGIINQSGGSIGVDSKLGRGTSFKIYLPEVEPSAEVVALKSIQLKARQGSETILLVEDNEAVRNLSCRVLSKSGYTVLVAGDGLEARRLGAQHPTPIDLLLTDVIMPGGLTGPQLAQELTEQQPLMKTVFMSGYTDNAFLQQNVLDSRTGFLQKPFTPNDLLLKVRDVLDTAG
ncbi:MAG TPA: response regulator [Anaerolineae bacterium]|nr:response regulator [Anaerolineae bacterium]HMR64138.1 response regulator [Anaerolineae bacterium]